MKYLVPKQIFSAKNFWVLIVNRIFVYNFGVVNDGRR